MLDLRQTESAMWLKVVEAAIRKGKSTAIAMAMADEVIHGFRERIKKGTKSP